MECKENLNKPRQWMLISQESACHSSRIRLSGDWGCVYLNRVPQSGHRSPLSCSKAREGKILNIAVGCQQAQKIETRKEGLCILISRLDYAFDESCFVLFKGLCWNWKKMQSKGTETAVENPSSQAQEELPSSALRESSGFTEEQASTPHNPLTKDQVSEALGWQWWILHRYPGEIWIDFP